MNKIEISTKKINTFFTKMMTTNRYNAEQICERTKVFIKILSNSSIEIIEDFLKNKTCEIPIRDIDAKLFRYGNILLYRSGGEKSYNLEQNLKLCKGSGITPNFIRYFELGENDFLTVLDAGERNLVPYIKVTDKIQEDTKQKFMQAVRKLYKNGIANKEIFANNNALMVTNDGENIIYADWGNLIFLSQNEKNKMFEFIQKWQI